MTIVESRLKTGTLTLGDEGAGGETFACQATNVRVTPSYDDDGDAVETLCGDEIPAGKKESWVLAGTSIQDFDDPDGFLAYCYLHAMETTAFTWTPNPDGLTWAGSCVVVALEEGGDVNTRLTTDWEFDVVGRPTRTYAGAVAATGATAGTPGTFTPAGAAAPANLAAMTGITASPTTAWTTGQSVVLGDASSAHWSSSAWVVGVA
jgi:hypothetical protein